MDHSHNAPMEASSSLFAMTPSSTASVAKPLTPGTTTSTAGAADSPALPNKRPRPVLSCMECRRKKLKCDRLLPCNQCSKNGQSRHCCYYSRKPSGQVSDESDGETRPKKKRAERTGSVAAPRCDVATPQPQRSPIHGGMGVVEDLQARVARLEGMLLGQTNYIRTIQVSTL
jgi:hypothetical protein